MSELLALYNRIHSPSGYIIDIGASTGVSTDPVYPFITDKSKRGLCIEGSEAKVAVLRGNTHFDVHCGFVTPLNICQIFEVYNVPTVFDVLKIDIDGYDLDVIRAILRVYRPKIIVTEFNEKIPPPVRFEIPYQEGYAWDESHCFGFSIAAGQAVMEAHQYQIVGVYELNNILCIDTMCMPECMTECMTEMKGDIGEIYRAGYANNASRHKELPWNQNINYWLEIRTLEALKAEILFYFTQDNGRSKFERKTKIWGKEFLLE